MKNTKRIIYVFVAALMLAASVFSMISCKFENKEVTSVTVAYDQGDTVVYAGTSLDELKGSLTVTLNYSDGTAEVTADYVLSGTLTEGSSVITVSCQGFERTFTVNVSAAPIAEHTHSLIYHGPKAASCTENGNVEYWSCSVCEKNYSDENAENEIDNTVIPAAHTGATELRGYVAATEYTDGYSGDTYCLGCESIISYGSILPHTSTAPAIVISELTVNDGKVTLVISLINDPGIESLKFDVFCGTDLVIESIEFSESLGAYATSPEPYMNPQTFNVIKTDKNASLGGELVTVTLSVSEELTESVSIEIVIIPDDKNIFDADMNEVKLEVVGATVTVNA